MNNVKESKGINLVALTITIIVLLILSGIQIMVLTNVGLFEKTKQAKQSSENAQELENKTVEEYEKKIGEIAGSRDSKELSVEYKTNITFNEEYVDVEKSRLTVVKYGNVATVTGYITLAQTNSNGSFIYLENLPKPIDDLYFVASDENAQKVNMKIDKDGIMYNYWSGNTIKKGNQIRWSMTYICE